MSQRIVIGDRIGGYCLGTNAMQWLIARGCKIAIEYAQDCGLLETHDVHFPDIQRDDPLLVECVETLGDTGLSVVDIPDGVEWHISSSDSGNEWVAENHRTWP